MKGKEMTDVSRDKQVFTHTAKKTKSINLGGKIFRGGIRL